jgi:hypothetical protein
MTAARDVAERLGPVGLWTRQLDMQPTERVRAAVAELEGLGWGSLWTWEVLGREALTNAGLLLAASRRMVIGPGSPASGRVTRPPWRTRSGPSPRPTRTASCSASA